MALNRQTTLSKQTSQMFQMTIDEFQNSLGGSGKIGSLNLEEFISTVWDQQQHSGPSSISPDSMYQQDAPVHTPSLPSQYSSQSSADYSGKTVEEVWTAIQAGKGGAGVAGKPMEAVTLGSFLQSVGVEMPPYVASDYHAAMAHMQPDHKGLPMMAQAPRATHILPQHSAAVPTHNLRLDSLTQPPLEPRGAFPAPTLPAQPPLFERTPHPAGQPPHTQPPPPRLYAPAEVQGVVLERPPGLVGVGSTQRGGAPYPSPPSSGLLGIAKLEPGMGLTGRGYANGAVASTAMERPGLTSLPKQQGGRGYPAGEVHATATIQMGPGWSGTKNRSEGGKDPAGLPPLGKRKKSENGNGSGEMADEEPVGETPPKGSRQRRRKTAEIDELDDRTARQQKRMVKNRESAARSRARKQEYTAQLEVQVAKLKEENRQLMEKVMRQCPPPAPRSEKPPGDSALRRTRTVPMPELKSALGP